MFGNLARICFRPSISGDVPILGNTFLNETRDKPGPIKSLDTSELTRRGGAIYNVMTNSITVAGGQEQSSFESRLKQKENRPASSTSQ